MGLIDWLKEEFRRNIEDFKGVEVPIEQARERLAICNACEFKIPDEKGGKCGLCTCPLSVKPYFEYHIFSALNLTVERDEHERTKVICPYKKDGVRFNKWEEIDIKYKKIKEYATS